MSFILLNLILKTRFEAGFLLIEFSYLVFHQSKWSSVSYSSQALPSYS